MRRCRPPAQRAPDQHDAQGGAGSRPRRGVRGGQVGDGGPRGRLTAAGSSTPSRRGAPTRWAVARSARVACSPRPNSAMRPPGTVAVVAQRDAGSHAREREVAVPARELLERPPVLPGAEGLDLDQQLAGARARSRTARCRTRAAATQRSPSRHRSRKRASSASATAGSSAAGSACARLPPMVPRFLICG